jgi:uncharacterized protein DUF1360
VGSDQCRRTPGELLTCPFCLLCGEGVAFGLLFASRFTHLIAGCFTGPAGADFLHLPTRRPSNRRGLTRLCR